MTRAQAAVKVSKLQAVTVGRGATPAEAQAAARLARRLAGRFGLSGHAGASDRRGEGGSGLAPGVHVIVV